MEVKLRYTQYVAGKRLKLIITNHVVLDFYQRLEIFFIILEVDDEMN